VLPEEWFVAFPRHASKRLLRWVPGQFKHVRLFTRIGNHWLFLEYAWRAEGQCAVVPDAEADPWLALAQENAVVLRLKPGTARARWPLLYCVPFAAQMTGVRSSALRPDGFYRDCLRHGAEIVCGADP
jgi:hypothetical protein